MCGITMAYQSDSSGPRMARVEHQSLAALFVSAMRRHAAKPALVSPSGRVMTYRELDDRSSQLANALLHRGVGPGDAVAILLHNCIEFMVADLAIMKVGAAKAPLNDLLSAGDVAYLLEHSCAAAVIAHTSLIPLLGQGSLAPADGRIRIGLEDGPAVPAGFVSWETCLGAESPIWAIRDVPPDTTGLVIYTGGTTGKPKGVAHSHDALVHNILSQTIMAELGTGERMYLVTPLPHSAHMLCQAGLLRGATVWLSHRFEPEAALDLIQRERITWTFMVPTMIYKLLDSPHVENYDLSSLRTILYGASPIGRARLERALQVFGPILLQIYGQTEAPNFVTTLSKQDHLREELQMSCGQPALATQVRVMNDEGLPAPSGEVGEVQVRSVYTLGAYLRDPEATEAAYSGEWLRTGDAGYQIDSGHVFLVDRKKDMIISGGMNVYSTEVENVILSFPGVAQVMVIGVPDATWGEAVTAFVVLAGEALDKERLLDHCRAGLARYKVPKDVVVIPEIPLTAYAKPDKKALRRRYWGSEERGIS
jgi:fatty-acyl-CoA synthase/long-chain acyl-CoA synthetase